MSSKSIRWKVLVIVVSLAGGAGCKKLPEEVPYRGTIMMKGHYDDSFQILVGGDLLLDGEKVATIEAQEGHSLSANWKRPKAQHDRVMKGTYTVRVTTACGQVALAAKGPNKLWQDKSESDHAKDVEKDGAVLVFITPDLPERHDLLVNWGKGEHEVKVGAIALQKGKNRIPVFLEGCTSPPAVVVDGAKVGALDPAAKVHLISAEAGQCHQLQEFAFGHYDKPTRAPVLISDQVVPLESVPYYVFKKARDSLTVPKGVKGTVLSELMGVDCPTKPTSVGAGE